MKTSIFKSRVRIIFGLLILFCLIVIVRLYFLQIVNGDAYNDKADRQYTNVSVNTYDRGSIFFQDKNGQNIAAASLKTGYILALNVREMSTDTEAYYNQISNIIPIDAATFYAAAAKKDSAYQEIVTEIASTTEVQKLSQLTLPGIIIENEKWRYYPGESLAANIIGFIGYDDTGTNLVGRYGLEKYYNDTLARDGSNLYVNTFAEIFSNITQNFIDDKGREGDIVTSIDPEVQSYVEKEIATTNDKWHSQTTGAIVIDPSTGEIYAMATYPTFDPNDFKSETDVGVFGDPLVSNAYEMGSIVKALTMAAGLDSGAVTASSTYNDTASIKVDGSTIHNYDDRGRGVIPMQQILNQSLNVGASYVATKMGKATMLKYFEGYGIGSETGIDLPSEAAGNISNLLDNINNSKQVEFDTASFGQGISMTPIMTVAALSVLANGGKLIIPHVAKEIDYKVGLSKTIDYTNEAKQVLKPETSAEITQMLINVVDQELDKIIGNSILMPHYSVAAKTGTAQIARPADEGGGYYPDKYLHSFFGYFPAYKPRFLVFLYTVDPQDKANPQASEYADQTLTIPFFDITRFLINYYQIPPDR
jgi:cell division protein FtsI/penicillin-binding protein 2